MNASATVHYKLDLMIRLVDTTTGAVVEERNVRFLKDGQAVHPIPRGSGNFVFLNGGRENGVLEVFVYGYDPAHAVIDYKTLDERMPIQEVFLIPSENTTKGLPVITFSGKLPGLEELQAVNTGDIYCCISEFDERKRIMKLFKTHRAAMDDRFYGLIHPDRQDYEPFTVEKEISEAAVKISEPLKEPFSVNSPIARVVFGSTASDGSYFIRVRDESERLIYLVRYVVQGNVKYQLVDFHQLDGKALE